MTSEEFNKKYFSYLEPGHYGLAIDNDEVIIYLNSEFEKEIKENPKFAFSQIKLKFGMARVYAMSSKCDEWESKINKLIGKNK